MMIKALILLGIGVAACTGYDFSDPAFNEELFETYKDLRAGLQASHTGRYKRDVDEDECKRKFASRHKCCNEPINTTASDALSEFKKQCIQEIFPENDLDYHSDPFNCEKLQKAKSGFICVAECIARKFNVVNEEGDMDRDLILRHMKEKFTTPDTKWKLDAAERIVDKCLDFIKDTERGTEKCNPAILKMVYCMWKEYLLACPKELQVGSPKCEKMRERLEKGGDGINKGFFFQFLHPQEKK